MSDERLIHDIEGVGEIRARAGTSTSELAGAASFWQKQARLAQSKNATAWRDGFLTAVVSTSLIFGLVMWLLKLL